jgi:hypothetical protein
MDAVWQELIKALPWGFVLIVMRYLEIKDQKEQRVERAANAKEAEALRVANAAEKARVERDFEMEKNKLWAETIKTVLDRQTEASQRIVTALTAMQKDLSDKYDSMGITKDLLDAARREIAKNRRGDQ